MRKLKIYIDTSVIGGCFDDEFSKYSNQEMEKLAKKYIEEKIVSKKYADDALHIAIATIAKIDVLVSWNFKHIVNLNKINFFNGVNLKEGYNLLEIRTPLEINVKYKRTFIKNLNQRLSMNILTN